MLLASCAHKECAMCDAAKKKDACCSKEKGASCCKEGHKH